MPKLRRDKDGIYSREGKFYLQHSGKRVSLKTSDKEVARRRADEHKRRNADPSHAAAHVKTLEAACIEFRAYAKTGENKAKPPAEGTFEMYDTHFGNLCRVMGAATRLADIDAAEADAYIATRRAERVGPKAPAPGKTDARRFVTPSTVDKELGTLRQILRLGLRRGWFHLPLDRVLPESSGAQYVPLTRYLTVEQMGLLLRALTDRPVGSATGFRGVYRHKANPKRWEVKLTLYKAGKNDHKYIGYYSDPIAAARAYDEAARAQLGDRARLNFPDGEQDPAGRVATCAYLFAFGADWCAAERAERFDLGTAESCNRMVLIRGTKNAARWAEVPRVAPFHPFAELAREWLVRHGSFPAWLNATRDLAAACRRAGLPRVTLRDLRRSHGKALAALGVSPHLIGRMLRHTDSRMAEKVYAVPERSDVGLQVSGVTRRAI